MTDINVESTDSPKEDGVNEELDSNDTLDKGLKTSTDESSEEENVEELKPKKESELDLVKKERDSFKEKYYYLAAEQENALKRFEREKSNLVKFANEKLLSSINKAKWNIYAVALQDLTFYTFSYLNVNSNFDDIVKSKEIFDSILENEKKNGMPLEVSSIAKKDFENRFEKVDWKNHYNSLPFNDSALALYEWAPIAEELKTLDRKIVLNSMILKWDNIKDEFNKLVRI